MLKQICEKMVIVEDSSFQFLTVFKILLSILNQINTKMSLISKALVAIVYHYDKGFTCESGIEKQVHMVK